MKNLKEKKGSLTVEAAIIIVLFVFGYISIVTVTDFIRAQMIIQYSIAQTAKEISGYCYILARTNLMSASGKLDEEAESAKADADSVVDTVVKLYEAVDSGTENITSAVKEIPGGSVLEQMEAIGDVSELTKEEYNKMASAAETMMEEAENYFSNPDAILKGLLSVAKDEGFSKVKSYVLAAPISRSLVKSQLDAYGLNQNGEDILERLGVVNGINGLNFRGSTLFNDGKTITVSVSYTMKVELPFFEKKEFHYIQTASTKAWGSGIDYANRPWRE